MKKKLVSFMMALTLAGSLLTGCGSSATYKDGTYTGKSEIHENQDDDGNDAGNGYGVVEITIKDGKITDCTYQTFEPDGTLKDENYGKKQGNVANRDYYNKAQKALAACDEYAKQLVENGQLDGIDAISGATINYDEFVEAVDNALSQAQE